MRKVLSAITIILFSCDFLASQQLPNYSLYNWNRFVLNPAFSCLQDSSEIRLSYRNQWNGFSANPSTINAGGFGQFGNGLGFSGFVIKDQTGGAYSQLAMQLAFSKYLMLNQDTRIGFGLGLSLSQLSFDNSIMQLIQADDPSFPIGIQRSMIPDASVGFYLQDRNLSVGFGSNQLFQNKVNSFASVNQVQPRLTRHYYLHGSYRIQLKSDFSLIPSMMLAQMNNSELQATIQLGAEFNTFVTVGLNMQVGVGPSVFFQFNRKKINFGYCYDIPGGALQNYYSGSHELVFGYFIGGGKEEVKQSVSDQD
jgi:type IX secretion system PorP/SprF family membrane protein